MVRRVLFVDDEPKVLQALTRQLSDRFELDTAPGAEDGLQILLADDPYAVVVSDYRMPGMNGIQFLARVRAIRPDAIRIMLTGQADFTTAITAVNEGNIFRFLTKPCPTEMLVAAIEAGLEQYRLVTAERELLEQTLRGSVQVLAEVLRLASPQAFSRANRVLRYVTHIAARLALPNAWELEVAAMLCQLGCVTVPQEVLDKVACREALSPAEQEVYAAHPAVAARLLEKIPRLDTVAHIIRSQNNPPASPAADISAGAVLRAALEFDRLVVAGSKPDAALAEMRRARTFNSRFLEVLATAKIDHVERQPRMVRVMELDRSMIINQDVRATNGLFLLPKGEELTIPMIARLRNFDRTVGIPQPLSVLVVRAATPESVPEDVTVPLRRLG